MSANVCLALSGNISVLFFENKLSACLCECYKLCYVPFALRKSRAELRASVLTPEQLAHSSCTSYITAKIKFLYSNPRKPEAVFMFPLDIRFLSRSRQKTS